VKQVLASVIGTSEVMPGVFFVTLEAPEIASAAQPGQFLMVRCGEDTLLRRPLSIHQVSKKTRLALLFKVIGKGTQWLAQRKVGDKLDLLGPLGNGFAVDPDAKNVLLLAGGIGIAPLGFLAQEALRLGHTVRLLLGAPSARHLYPMRYLPTVSELLIATDDGSTGEKGMITDILPKFLLQPKDQVFACGPLGMYRDMLAKHSGLLKDKPVQISLEMRMGCGIGICYACTVKTRNGLKQVCKDGPVFNLQDVLWEELKAV